MYMCIIIGLGMINLYNEYELHDYEAIIDESGEIYKWMIKF